MSVSDNQRNIKAKIQAFEKQGSIDLIDEAPLVKPEPRPRTSQNKPPPAVAAKPSFSRRPTGLWEPLPGMGAGIEFNRKETQSPPTPRPRPMVPRALSESEAGDAVPAKVDKVPLLPPSRPSVMPRSRTLTAQEEVAAITPPIPPPKIKPAADPPALNNHNPPPTPPTKPAMENGNTGRSHSNAPIKPQRSLNSAPNPPSVARKPTMIRVPSRVEKSPGNEALDPPPPLPVQKPIGGVPLPITRKPTLISRPTYPPPPVENSKPEGFGSAVPEISLPPRLSGGKVLPPRPPPAKGGPGRPPPPRAEVAPIAVPTQLGRVAVLPKRLQSHKGAPKKGPVLPPRPNPGHPLYNTYTLGIPHAIAEFDYNGSNTAELSFQKNEVLVLLEQMDNNTFECQVGDTKGPVHKSYLKIITPLSSVPSRSSPQPPRSELPRRGSSGLQVQALHDFTPEGPEELALRAGDLVCMVERVDSEWYHGTCRGASGIFPISFVRVLSTIPAPPNGQKAPPAPATVSGPRCVARFDFEGEHSDELTFAEGDVISLKEYVGEEWARGQFNGYIGIFPLDFVEIVEDLPAPPPQAQHGAQPAMPAQHTMLPPAQHAIQPPPEHTIQLPAHQSMLPLAQHTMPSPAQHAIQLPAQHTMPPSAQRTAQIRIPLPGMVPISQKQQAAKPSQSHSRPPGAEWGLAMYDFTAETEEDLSFQEGAVILITEHVDSEWCRGRLDGKEGYFPAAFVEPCEAPMEEPESPKTEGEGRGRALYDFVSECEDELSLKVGDIITGLESIDDEWFFGELNGTRGLVPKNYVQVL
ncbi:hypothetical protein JZ751_012543 [Albula glossodonta]|uniref:SH3 domain-containing protein n=1 Tax=Albula glossodonta TaxID=121402 RepID=A0A8T2NV96_9TELE|nr:hypothetical protein JZ751_012543 [Albula glossodonta]